MQTHGNYIAYKLLMFDYRVYSLAITPTTSRIANFILIVVIQETDPKRITNWMQQTTQRSFLYAVPMVDLVKQMTLFALYYTGSILRISSIIIINSVFEACICSILQPLKKNVSLIPQIKVCLFFTNR